jgi:hypothetical protein
LQESISCPQCELSITRGVPGALEHSTLILHMLL